VQHFVQKQHFKRSAVTNSAVSQTCLILVGEKGLLNIFREGLNLKTWLINGMLLILEGAPNAGNIGKKNGNDLIIPQTD